MKKIHLFLVGLILSVATTAQENDPVVLTIDGDKIHASEFLYIYSKNNDNPSFNKDSLNEYMELFINYKLKVKEAKAQQYDTIPRLINELKEYRQQLSLPYMTDKEKNEELIKEAYDRTVNEVRASHILIRLASDPSPEDTAQAYVRAMQLRTRINNGESFESVARGKGGSEDPSVEQNGGDLGYFSALQMVYPFEDAAFKTPVGEVSMPVRTRFGYHLIKVDDKRPAKGMIETAHILILVDAGATDEEKDQAKKKIDEIYALLEGGQKFEELAAKYSDDQSSKGKGGLLPIFGSGAKQRMVPDFEQAAFALVNDGDYTKPVKTIFGYHIIKRIQLIPVPTYDQMYRELKLRVERDMRAETTKAAFVEELKKSYNYVNDAQKLLPIFYNTVGDEIFMGKWKGLKDHAHDNDILFTFKDNMATIKDFETYVLDHQTKSKKIDKADYFQEQLDNMVRERLFRYEDSQLEMKYPEFKALINEYADGILVFEIMQDEIWKKASKDTAGIRSYYENHRNDFLFPVRYKGDLYTCKDKATAKAVANMAKSDTLTAENIAKTLNKNSELNVNAKSQIFSSETTEAFKLKKNGKLKTFKNGVNKPYKNGDVYYVLKVEETMAPRPREFNEAKGLVTAAYQNQLEKEWLASLRQKYAVTINTENLHNLKGK